MNFTELHEAMNPPSVMTGTMEDIRLLEHRQRLHAYALNPALLEDTAMTPTNTKDAATLRRDAELVDLKVRIRIGEVLLDAVNLPQGQRSQGWTEAVMVLTNCYCGLRGDQPK